MIIKKEERKTKTKLQPNHPKLIPSHSHQHIVLVLLSIVLGMQEDSFIFCKLFAAFLIVFSSGRTRSLRLKVNSMLTST